MGSTILDTNVVIYLLDGKLAEQLGPAEIGISVITEIELLGYHALTPEAEQTIRTFLSLARTHELDASVKDEAIRLRRTLRLKLGDAIIAATAIVANVELYSLDQGFADVPGLRMFAPELK